MRRVSARYALAWVVAVSAAATAAVTAWKPGWIEALFGVDPDHGGGAAEWGLVIVALAVLVLAGRALREESRDGEPRRAVGRMSRRDPA